MLDLIANIFCGIVALTGFAFLARYVYITSLLNEDKVRNQNPCAVWLARVLLAIVFAACLNHILGVL